MSVGFIGTVFMYQAQSLSAVKTVVYTIVALIAFAANSVLCRLALGNGVIDAESFTSIRLVSGIVALFVILAIKRMYQRNSSPSSETRNAAKGSWFGAITLFAYALGFSYAYNSLETGTGALILFGVVQITMILVSILSGNKLHVVEWLGVGLAFFGFVYLVLPGVTAPSLSGFTLMTVAGIAWGYYTLNGKGSRQPLIDTAYNFLRTIPFVLVLVVFSWDRMSLTTEGVALAVASGALTSGMGYAIWYAALTGLKTMQAAVLQLLVPVIASVGGILFVSEILTLRLIISSLLILGGIFLVVIGRQYLVGRSKNI